MQVAFSIWDALSGIERDLRELNEKLERLMHRLDYLEAILTESRNYPELARLMGDLRVGAALYGEPLRLIQRLLNVRRHLERSAVSRNEVSRIILNALALKGPMNISQLTREVARERGSASRVTVRKRINMLLDVGVVEKDEGFEYKLVE